MMILNAVMLELTAEDRRTAERGLMWSAATPVAALDAAAPAAATGVAAMDSGN